MDVYQVINSRIMELCIGFIIQSFLAKLTATSVSIFLGGIACVEHTGHNLNKVTQG